MGVVRAEARWAHGHTELFSLYRLHAESAIHECEVSDRRARSLGHLKFKMQKKGKI